MLAAGAAGAAGSGAVAATERDWDEEYLDLILAVVHALAGWQPPGFANVFAFRTAELLSLAGGVASYDLRFHIPSYIRT